MPKVIFVNGTARCGSTMVDLMLGNDPTGFSLGEVSSWFRPWRTHHFDIKCGCGVYPCQLWEEVRQRSENELYDAVLSQTSADFVVDSSKKMTWLIDQIRRLRQRKEFEVWNLFLYKDPVSLYHSHWKRGSRDLAGTARHYLYYSAAIQARIPFVAVNYDWLVSDIQANLPIVCAAVGIPYFEGKEKFWTKTHHHLFGSLGPRKQLRSDAPQIYVEKFAPEYANRMLEYKDAFADMPELQQILAELEARDIRSGATYDQEELARVRRPKFYFRQRIKEVRRKFLPEPAKDREASTIREWNV